MSPYCASPYPVNLLPCEEFKERAQHLPMIQCTISAANVGGCQLHPYCFSQFPAEGVTHILPIIRHIRFPVIWSRKPMCHPSTVFSSAANINQYSEPNSSTVCNTALYNISDNFMSAPSLHIIFPNLPQTLRAHLTLLCTTKHSPSV